MILVAWITACFFVLNCPTPPGFNLSMTTVCMCFVWFCNHDTCCWNYSMSFWFWPAPPLQVSILAWKLIPRKWKETYWKTIPKWKRKKILHFFSQNETIIFKNQTITIKEQRLHVFFAERRCDLRLFPTVSSWTPLDLQKKNGVARKCFFEKKCGLNKFWPDHVSDRFRPFPTVSDRFRPFHFFWTINWTNSIYGRLIQCKPVQTMTLKFFCATLVRVHCTKYCILTLIFNIP